MIRSSAVGKRVRVYWADEDEWFSGQVQDADEEQGYFVLYDDGDERWEASAQLVEFEESDEQQQRHDSDESGGDDDTDEQQQLRQRSDGHAPRMMEPPASPFDAYDDDHEEEDGEGESKRTQESSDTDGSGASDEDADDAERIHLADAAATRAAQGNHDDDEDHSDEQRGDSDDGEQSIAMSDVPIMFERLSSGRHVASPPLTSRSVPTSALSARSSTTASRANVNLPIRGVLYGKVLRANHLPSIPSAHTTATRQMVKPPRAFVKIAFVEAATGAERASRSANNVMLRCKNALASTSVAQPSSHPVWNDPDTTEQDEADGAFQMQLVPPVTSPKEPPAWLQLRGDVLFSVYSTDNSEADQEEDDDTGRASGRGRHVPDFIGQAVLPLRDILQNVLYDASPCISRRLPLQTRQGKPLSAFGSGARNAIGSDDDDEDEANAPVIVVAFEFEPTFATDNKQRITKTSRTTSQSTRSLSTKDRGLAQTASARSLASQPKRVDHQRQRQQAKALASSKTLSAQAKQHQKKKAPPPSHTSSSNINRRRFEKQIDQQNLAFAKRIEWQDQRRARRSGQAKAQAKSKVPVPQHGSMKLDHKASSSVNRAKFQQQVRQENRAMEKRLHAIVLKDEPKCTSGEQCLPKFSDIAFDALDKDELLARDRRQQRLREQDFLEACAQAKYQQKNAVVDEVLKLQSELAELRAQMFSNKTAVTRLDILNNKDQHLCNCLRSAAEAIPTATSGSSGIGKSVKRKATTTNATKDSDTSAEGSASIARQRKELELLQQEAASLSSEKQSHSQELRSCSQKQQELDDQVEKLTFQLRFVHAKQAFQQRMNSKTGGTQQQLLVAKEMKKKAQLLDLSSEEEELWALYQAQQELTQLQIAIQVLKERQDVDSASASKPPGSSLVACEYLEKKINRQKQKLEQLEQEQHHFQREYEALAVSGTQESLRKQVRELQQTLFLCQSQQKHARMAQRHAKLADEKLTMELHKQVFNEQTETEILFKKTKAKPPIE